MPTEHRPALLLMGLLIGIQGTNATAFIGDFSHRILNPTPEGVDQFAKSVAAADGLLVVGAPADNTGAPGAGSIYVYDSATRQLLRTINNPFPGDGDQFGWSVSSSQRRALVGAPAASDAGPRASGAAYLFDAVTGVRLRTFNNPTPVELDLFGYSVALSTDRAVVGAIEDGTVGNKAGAAYVFNTATGQLEGPSLFPVPGGGQEFGHSVAWIGSDIAVGAPGSGTVYLFDGATKGIKNVFFTQTGDVNDRFGHAIANSNGRLLVGAPKADFGDDEDTGAAYLIDVNSGALLQTFRNPSSNDNDNFGFAVAATSHQALIGAYSDDTQFTNAGAAHVMDIDTGRLVKTLVPVNPLSSDFFGVSVAADAMFFVGASGVGPEPLQYGAAYAFQGRADFDDDGDVDGGDFLIWQRGLGITTGAKLSDGDADGDGGVDADDLSEWREQFAAGAASASTGNVPEPSSIMLSAPLALGTVSRHLRLSKARR